MPTRIANPITSKNSVLLKNHTIPSSPAYDTLRATAPRGLGILVVDEELPFPLNTGKRIRTYHLLRHLAKRHRITFVCHRNADLSERSIAEKAIAELGIEVVFIDRALPSPTLLTPKPQLAFGLAKNLFSSLPYLVQKHISREMISLVQAQASRPDIDLVHIEWTPYAAAVAEGIDKPVIVDAHNVESLIWKRYVEHEPSWIRRAYIRYQWRKLERFERETFQRTDQTVFVSEEDARLARSEFGATHGVVVENGVDTEWYQPVYTGRDKYELLVMGSLDWRPNIDGIEQFLRNVFPQIRAAEPRATVTVIGRNPGPAFEAWVRTQPAVELHANVPDVQMYTQRAGALVVPLRIGGGSRLKILEAAAAGLPILSTAIGAEGLRFEPDVHFAAADSIEGLGDTILQYCQLPELAHTRAVAARELVERGYDWSVQARDLERCWLAEIPFASAPPSPRTIG